VDRTKHVSCWIRNGDADWATDDFALFFSETGNQPMISADGKIVTVCNGEIYNYRELGWSWKVGAVGSATAAPKFRSIFIN